MITKPEDAIPNCAGTAHNTLLEQDCGGDPFPPWFTASECAEIARAYADVCLMVEGTGKKEYLRKWQAWESKFKKWETK